MAPLGNRPGLILRTWAGVGTEGLRRHLRLMTRHRDRAGKWYFLRFCEVRTAGALWASFPEDDTEPGWRYGSAVRSVIRPEGDDLVCTGPDAALPQRSATPGTIDTYRPLFRAARWEAFRGEIHRALRAEGPPFDTVPPEDTAALCDEVRAADYRREAAVWNVVRAAILARTSGADLTDLTRASRLPDDDLSASDILYSRARALAPPET